MKRNYFKQIQDIRKQDIYDWLIQDNPSHFLTVQLREGQKTDKYHLSLRRLKDILITFENQLLGRHWNKKHLEFKGSAENKVSGLWHYHLLLQGNRFSDEELYTSLSSTANIHDLTIKPRPEPPDCPRGYNLDLEPIANTPEQIASYITKEVYIDYNHRFDPYRIIMSHDLFNIPAKSE
jgi:hypothetical protein